MSLQTWMDEYFPSLDYKTIKETDAIRGNILTWTGLSRKNLFKHQVDSFVSCSYPYIMDAYDTMNRFYVDIYHLPLCIFVMNQWAWNPDRLMCDDCPIKRMTGTTCWYDKNSPYKTWTKTLNIRPMLKTLQETLHWVEGKNANG